MVLVSSKKYACETCIKGHRSSTCKHTDRPLFEIKKKGRPVTQCEHCRELRKTKQVHVKCLCELKGDNTGACIGTSKKGSKVPETAAFPNGLPEALEASVSLQSLSEGSDSDHGGERSACACKSGGDCHCCTPRTSVPRNRRRASESHRLSDATAKQSNLDDSSDVTTAGHTGGKRVLPAPSNSSHIPSSHILARIAELRPVLPRPVTKDLSATGPLHDPSSGTAHGHGGRHHAYESMYYSPYGRAYEYNYAQEQTHNHPDRRGNDLPLHAMRNTDSTERDDEALGEQILQGAIAAPWNPLGQVGSRAFSSLCGCGDSCSCPGCVQHNTTTATATSSVSALATCTNPGACAHCLDCSILSLPSLPLNTALSIYDPEQAQNIDEWIRQVSAMPSPGPSSSVPFSTSSLPDPSYYTSSPWDSFQMPRISQPVAEHNNVVVVTCPVGRCDCPPGLCTCQPEKPDLEAFDGSGVGLTFATSGERLSCCGSPANSAPVPGNEVFPGTSSVQVDTGGYLTVPDIPRSRSSSSSSQSSLMSFGRVPGPAPAGRVQKPSRSVLRKSVPSLTLALSPPKLSANMLPSLHRRDTSGDAGYRSSPDLTGMTSPSATHSREGSSKPVYANSNPDSEGSLEDAYSQYDPSLDGMQLY